MSHILLKKLTSLCGTSSDSTTPVLEGAHSCIRRGIGGQTATCAPRGDTLEDTISNHWATRVTLKYNTQAVTDFNLQKRNTYVNHVMKKL